MEPSEPELKLTTICRDCVFAKWNNDFSVQTGCELGRLDIYKSRNRASLESNKDNISYYRIDTICNTCRTKEWSDMFQNPKEKIMEQVQIKTDIVIIYNPDTFENHINFLSNSEFKPGVVYVVQQRGDSRISANEILSKTKLTYEIMQYFVPTTVENILEDVVHKSSGYYYLVLNGREQIPCDILKDINRRFNYDLKPFSLAISPYSNYHGYVIQSKLHKVIGGFYGQNMIEKIKILSINQDAKHMIVSIDNI